MSKSYLTDYEHYSPNYSRGRVNVTKIAVHYVDGPCTVETLGDIFADPARRASSNYGVDLAGRVGMYVTEDNRSWCTSSAWCDNRAITIEVSNYADGSTSAAAMDKLIELMVDICRRYDFGEFVYTGTKEGNLVAHRWFAETDCPGNWLYARFPWIAEQVNERLHSGTDAGHGTILEDGWWGRDTTRLLQECLNMPFPPDGEIWHQNPQARQTACTGGWSYDLTYEGSATIAALQRKLGVDPDGLLGPDTIRALERRMGTYPDGRLEGPSPTVRILQHRLNNRTF